MLKLHSVMTVPLFALALFSGVTGFQSAIAQATPPNLLAQGNLREGGNLLRELNLTPDQTRRIQTIRSQYRGRLEQSRQNLQRSQQELRNLMTGNTPTEQVRQKFLEVQSFREELSNTQFSSMLEIREVLTLEQRRKFAEIVERQMGMLRERLGR